MMGIPFVGSWQGPGGTFFSLSADAQKPIPVTGYEHLIPSLYFYAPSAGARTVVESVEVEGTRYALAFRQESSSLTVTRIGGAPRSARDAHNPRLPAPLMTPGPTHPDYGMLSQRVTV